MALNFVTSKYIQISDWALIEYEYSSMNTQTHNSIATTGNNSTGIYRITNNITKEYQFANYSFPRGDVRNLGNSLAWTLIPTNQTQSKWATSNIIDSTEFNPSEIYNLKNGDPIPIEPNYVLDDLSSDVISHARNAVRYDTIRVHIISGYNLEGIDGFILDVEFLENSNKKMKASTSAYLKNNVFNIPTFNPNPIMMGERMYDKYVTIYVPSLYQIQDEFYNYKSDDNIFAKLYSHPSINENPNPGGFLKDSTIYLTLHELISTETKNSIEFYDINQKYNATISTSDTYSFLSCTVYESKNGDYFEYFPMWQGEFLEDYITLLNNNYGNVWSVVHNIKVVEQIGNSFYTTSDLTIPQASNFTEPSLFRPIIKHSADAFAFSLVYTMRLINASTGEQVLRTSSLTSYDPKKYGTNTKRIKIDEGIQPYKVYNKIVNETVIPSHYTPRSENMFTTKYIPQYIERKNVCVNMTNSAVKQMDTIIYGQGKCQINISKFDNVIKFVLLNIEGTSTLPINITGQNLYIKFIQDNNQEISIKNVFSSEIYPDMGEVVFNIMKEDSNKILKIQNDKNYYIVSRQDNSAIETVIYQGTFAQIYNTNTVDENTVQPFTLYLNKEQARIDKETEELKKLQDELEILIKNNKALQENLNTQLNKLKTEEPEKPYIHPKNPNISSELKDNTVVSNTNVLRSIPPVSTKIQTQITNTLSEK